MTDELERENPEKTESGLNPELAKQLVDTINLNLMCKELDNIPADVPVGFMNQFSGGDRIAAQEMRNSQPILLSNELPQFRGFSLRERERIHFTKWYR